MIIGQAPEEIIREVKSWIPVDVPWWYLETCTFNEQANYQEYLEDPGITYTAIADKDSGEEPQFEHLMLASNGDIPHEETYHKIFCNLWRYFEQEHDLEFTQHKRVKANMLMRSRDPHKYHTPHVDYEKPHKVILYYVNDSDGPTYFFKQKFNGMSQKLEIDRIVHPKAGRYVIFDGLTYHASSSPVTTDHRCVTNINYI